MLVAIDYYRIEGVLAIRTDEMDRHTTHIALDSSGQSFVKAFCPAKNRDEISRCALSLRRGESRLESFIIDRIPFIFCPHLRIVNIDIHRLEFLVGNQQRARRGKKLKG